MTIQSTRNHVRPPEENQLQPEETGGAGSLLEQASAYANVARAAHRDCEQGKDAEQALNRRRNRSGQ